MDTETFRSDQAAIKAGYTEDVRMSGCEVAKGIFPELDDLARHGLAHQMVGPRVRVHPVAVLLRAEEVAADPFASWASKSTR
jgi:hypothetical protein